MNISVAARGSPLSQAQLSEVQAEISKQYPEIVFFPLLLDSLGDKDLKTSLRTLGKTDFFTREIDEAILCGKCRIAIHSAKDLPEQIPEGLEIIAITKGVDASDSLVLRDGESLHTLAPKASIAASSLRREEVIKSLRADLTIVDIRGNIGQRIEKLTTKQVDGVVVAEAALIRLKLTHLNRITLPGETTPLQGQLAIVARAKDTEMKSIFSLIDSRAVF